MSAGYPAKKQAAAAPSVAHKIRIILSSRKVPALEKVCKDLVNKAKSQQDTPVKVKGPMRMPTKTLKIMTMKSPCGEGTITWDRYQMRVHKRVIDLVAPSEMVKKITSINIEAGVDVEVTVQDA